MGNWMSLTRLVVALVAAGVLSAAVPAAQNSAATEWSRFRGPNGSGHAVGTEFPTEFNKTTNMVWRLALPPGHSSPIVWKDRIYLTAFRGEALFTIAIDRASGKLLWERQAPETKTRILDKRNNPASPSPAVEDDRVYVFFPDYGLLAYDAAGKELWQMRLGPFDNIYGMGAHRQNNTSACPAVEATDTR
jgi:hypothetical protein